ncbi:GDSL-type esterase/lipase family protein [Leptolyngbya sp. NIES-2104]|uniref:GDSL-type esterase/lipase family protein n=1 Tax=Leptolyngbya sp. NIES-2104 TaxID=1552121 RepID=UPI0006EC52C9|nr:GDSL-type esterase/lipase family protein [Leptolyngbya sp. NIES-2104]GAP96008.1 N-acetylneuraminate cytidylyltransferase [Leptolyngbya sp. NIES-2104]
MSKSIPGWVYLSVVTNVVLGTTLGLWFLGDRYFTEHLINPPAKQSMAAKAVEKPEIVAQAASMSLGRSLTYQDWVDLLGKEANAMIKKKPDRLIVLAGDSLTLWFPQDLLPTDYNWLNQGISGETTSGLVKRLKLFDQAKPKAIFVMVGINDLLRGKSEQEVLEAQEEIINQLKKSHPKAKIVIQALLPRAKESITTANATQVEALSNDRIFQFNRRLAGLADQAGVEFLDLQPLFSDSEGFLRSELTTDGLHLSTQGYLVWRSAIQTFNQFALR